MSTILSDSGLTLASGNILDLKSAIPSTGSYTIGDIILEIGAANRLSGWKRQTTGAANVLGTDWLYFNTPTAPHSTVRLNTFNGYGSTNTQIRRFTNVVANQGSDITYSDSATLGASFTINTAGVYNISYNDSFGGATFLGISLNSSQLTTAIQTITDADRLALGTCPAANLAGLVSGSFYLPAGSVIRAHADSSGGIGQAARCNFTITRVA